MKILAKEIGLRDETRSLEQARAALESAEYEGRAAPLAELQLELAHRVVAVGQKLRDTEDEQTKFPNEIALLGRVAQVMQEAYGLLDRPETGPPTIAAETEAIELLLQARRSNPSGGGGGGNTPGGGGKGTTDQSALALMGDGSARGEQASARTVEQATGVSGSALPAEFRSGLDAYFGALEQSGGQ